MIERLFVYGSLKPGHSNAHLLEQIGGSWQTAWVVGTLRPEGWGAEQGYPALTLDDECGTQVHGFVFSSEDLARHWQRLDEFEGDDYERAVTTARVDGGGAIAAYIYILSRRRTGTQAQIG
jgi:gamma-glutamylcyclotransferase (GGCT)/AIG2-like uncharacterized protein YtfP